METLIPITSLYAVLLAIYFVVVSVRVSLARGKTKISIGDGDNAFLLRRIRVQGNFAEYIPLALVLLLLAELQGLGSLWLHGAGALLLVGRLCMLYGLEYASVPGRVLAMVCTYIPIIAASGYLLLMSGFGG